MKYLSITILAALMAVLSVNAQEAPGAPALPGGGGLVPPDAAKADEAPADEQTQDIAPVRRTNFVLAKIRDNYREVDPFGMFMDPTNATDSTKLAKQYSELEEETMTLTNSSLKTALEGLPITGIYPQKRIVVLGARTLKLGSQFGMQLEDLTIRLRFEGIRGKSLIFRDMDTQEIASVEFNPLPKEFEPIRDNTRPEPGQGIVPMNDLFIVN